MKAKDLVTLRTNSEISFFVKEQGSWFKGYFQGAEPHPYGNSIKIHVNMPGIGFITKTLGKEDDITVTAKNQHYALNGVQAIQYNFTPNNEIWEFIDDRKAQDWVDENIKDHMDWILKANGVLIRLSDEQFQALKAGAEYE